MQVKTFTLPVGLNFSVTRCPRLSIYNEGDLVPFSSQYPAHEVHKMIDIFIESLRRVLRDSPLKINSFSTIHLTGYGRMPKVPAKKS